MNLLKKEENEKWEEKWHKSPTSLKVPALRRHHRINEKPIFVIIFEKEKKKEKR